MPFSKMLKRVLAPSWRSRSPDGKKNSCERCCIEFAGKALEQLVEHVTHDKLELWGSEPDGRTKAPLSNDEFAKKFREFVEKGAASPE
jgi:hypothetical protein